MRLAGQAWDCGDSLESLLSGTGRKTDPSEPRARAVLRAHVPDRRLFRASLRRRVRAAREWHYCVEDWEFFGWELSVASRRAQPARSYSVGPATEPGLSDPHGRQASWSSQESPAGHVSAQDARARGSDGPVLRPVPGGRLLRDPRCKRARALFKRPSIAGRLGEEGSDSEPPGD
jgi:hypothetical protein